MKWNMYRFDVWNNSEVDFQNTILYNLDLNSCPLCQQDYSII